jgi:hypothetical protein
VLLYPEYRQRLKIFGIFNRVVRKLQFLNNFHIKKHFCRAEVAVGNLSARKNAGLVRELTEFPNKSNIYSSLLYFPQSLFMLPHFEKFDYNGQSFGSLGLSYIIRMKISMDLFGLKGCLRQYQPSD